MTQLFRITLVCTDKQLPIVLTRLAGCASNVETMPMDMPPVVTSGPPWAPQRTTVAATRKKERGDGKQSVRSAIIQYITTNNKQEIMSAEIADIVKQMGCSRSTAGARIWDMMRAGQLERISMGRYRVLTVETTQKQRMARGPNLGSLRNILEKYVRETPANSLTATELCDVAEQAGFGRQSVYNNVTTLLARGYIQRKAIGLYTIINRPPTTEE